jgi:formylglycine-generating enzyme required for sulfatase activity
MMRRRRNPLSHNRKCHSGQTMVIIKGPTSFLMGSPQEEEGRLPDELLPHRVKLEHSFAIGEKEVTNQQFVAFLQGKGYKEWMGAKLDVAMAAIRAQRHEAVPVYANWFMAAEYCNWLTKQELGEDSAEDQLCYVPNESGEFAAGMSIHRDFIQRSGYRLPTE